MRSSTAIVPVVALALVACSDARAPRATTLVSRAVVLPVDARTGTPAAMGLFEVAGQMAPMRPDARPDRDRNDSLLVAVWNDGTIVWGRPASDGYRESVAGKLDSADFSSMQSALGAALGSLDDAASQHVMPDSGRMVVFTRGDGRRDTFESAHELFEENPGLVATQHGIEALEGRSREAAIAGWSPEYRSFRAQWDRCRAALATFDSRVDSAQPVEWLEFRRIADAPSRDE